MNKDELTRLSRSWWLSGCSLVKEGHITAEEFAEITKDVYSLDCDYKEGVQLVTDVINAAKMKGELE